MFWVCLFDCYYCFESDCCSNQLSPKSATIATLNIHFFLQMLRDGSIKYQKMAQVKYKYLKKKHSDFSSDVSQHFKYSFFS